MVNDNYIRVKKGMVFWYDINPAQNKLKSPKVLVRNSEFTDFAEYGNRPWVVISGDNFNANNTYCSIIPLSTGTRQISDSELKIDFFNKPTTVICSQIRFVNGVELKDWMGMLNDDVMKQIDEKMANYLGIDKVVKQVVKVERRDVVPAPIVQPTAAVDNKPKETYIPIDKNPWIYASKEYMSCEVYMKKQFYALLTKSTSGRMESIPISDLIKAMSAGLAKKPVCLFLFTHMFSELLQKNIDHNNIQYGMKGNVVGIKGYRWANRMSIIPTAKESEEKLTERYKAHDYENGVDDDAKPVEVVSHTPIGVEVTEKVPKKFKKRFHWNAELSHQVLYDHQKLTKDEFMDKYELIDKYQMSNMKSRAIAYLKMHAEEDNDNTNQSIESGVSQ